MVQDETRGLEKNEREIGRVETQPLLDFSPRPPQSPSSRLFESPKHTLGSVLCQSFAFISPSFSGTIFLAKRHRLIYANKYNPYLWLFPFFFSCAIASSAAAILEEWGLLGCRIRKWRAMSLHAGSMVLWGTQRVVLTDCLKVWSSIVRP